MIKNYFTIAFRNFWRNKVFSAINVSGLSIGISASLVIFLIVNYEFGYDTFEKDKDRIYRVVLNATFNGTEGYSASVPAPLGAAIQREVTGVENTIPIFQFQGDATAKVSIDKSGNENPLILKKQKDIVFTNIQYFQLLSYQFVAGSLNTSLQNPFSVVLTESRAKQYFSLLTPAETIGKQITYNDEITATVSGIVKDMEHLTSFTAVEFISLPTITKTNLQDHFMMTVWNDWMAYSQLYIKLAAGSTSQQTEAQLQALLKKYHKEANRDANNTMAFHLQPLQDVHFNSNYAGFEQRLAQKSTLYGLIAVAVFLLLLACINFINLTTAQAAQRAKEIGIRKTMGSSRKQLVYQFLGETTFVVFIATIVSVVLAPFLLRLFSGFIPQGIQSERLYQPYVFQFLLLLIILVSLLSGLYPALILSGYKPIAVLKNSTAQTGETRHAWFRKSLTVSQFVIAQFFIIATVMVSRQINYSIHADLGFNKEAIINFDTPRDADALHVQQLLNTINTIPEVEIASTGFLSPADKGAAFANIFYAEKKDIKTNVQIRWGDPNYLNVYQLKLLAGRNVAPSDTMKELIINNTYAQLLGFAKPEDAIGKRLTLNDKDMPVVGVMQDFHAQSMHALITPLVFSGSKGSTFHIRLKPNSSDGTAWQNAISKIQKAYKQTYAEADFEYAFFDEQIASFYENEQRIAILLKWATALAIFISCLGLLGLVLFTINTRRKEIGIRKILGASVANIVSVLSADFVRLVIVAFLIAVPIAWWAMYKWLQDFAYRTPISWWIFLLSGAGMLLIALTTLSIQTVKAAMANPVKSLRTE